MVAVGKYTAQRRSMYVSLCSYHWISSLALVTMSTSSTETSQHIHDSCVRVFTVHVFKACLPCVPANVPDEGGASVRLEDTWSTVSMLSIALLHIAGNRRFSTSCRLQPLGCSQREAKEAGCGNQVPGFGGQYFVIHADHHRM